MRQKLIAVVAVAALVATAGCTLPGVTTEKTTVHVSSQGEAVDDFQELRLSITKVGVYQTDSGKWKTTSVTKFVDLTNVQGNNTAFVTSMELPAGEYSKVYFKVDNVNGVLKDGTQTSVEVRSDQLETTKNLRLDGVNTTSYVVDLQVTANVDGAYLITTNHAGSGPNQPINPTSDESTAEA